MVSDLWFTGHGLASQSDTSVQQPYAGCLRRCASVSQYDLVLAKEWRCRAAWNVSSAAGFVINITQLTGCLPMRRGWAAASTVSLAMKPRNYTYLSLPASVPADDMVLMVVAGCMTSPRDISPRLSLHERETNLGLLILTLNWYHYQVCNVGWLCKFLTCNSGSHSSHGKMSEGEYPGWNSQWPRYHI